MALNAQSPLPLYHQLAGLLRSRIREGEYPTGARIPSEPELARAYGIGRPTVRQATDVLVRERLLERRRGSGTYVVEPPERVDLFSLAGTLASFERSGVPVRTAIVQRARRLRVPDDPEHPLAGRDAWALVRLSRARGKPVLLEHLWFDAERFEGLDRLSLAGRSLSQLAHDHYHLSAERADQNFRVTEAQADHAALLEIAPATPILLVKRSVHFRQAPDAVFAELRCRTDQLVFAQTLYQDGDPGPEASHA